MEKPNHERKSRGFREKLQQSAKNITSRERKAKSPKTPAQKRATRRKVWGVIGTICLVGVLTITIFVGIFMYYVNKTMKGSIEVPMSEYKPAVSTEMYYDKNAGTGENEDWYMYQTLYYEQNRIWVDLGQIPDYLQQAAIAIEDKRFESHHGVDWYGTMRAIVRTLTGGSMQGGSTITQQTIKNITGDNQDNVKRKIMEIYRALALEKEYSKDDILEVYLNTIYLGEMCYGVQTASQAYFGKDAADLTLAESACLIGITNNPSMYDPLLSDWTRENNRDRQLTILKAMLDQNKISSEEYEAAKNEEVVFTNGYTCLGNYVEDHPEALSPEEQEKVSTANNSFYTDQVIEDVADAFVELYNLQDDPADQENGRSAHSKAVSMIYSGGYKIYTAQNITLQQKVEAIYEDSSNLPYTRTTNGAAAVRRDDCRSQDRLRRGDGRRHRAEEGRPRLELGHGHAAVRLGHQTHRRLCARARRRHHHRRQRARRLSGDAAQRLALSEELPRGLLWPDERADGADGVAQYLRRGRRDAVRREQVLPLYD